MAVPRGRSVSSKRGRNLADRDSSKGFEGLSGMVSDGTVPAAETSAPAKYQMISLTKNPSMAAPWSGEGPGEGWKWGDYYVTVQTNPVTLEEVTTKRGCGGLSYHFSATVFRDPEQNDFGKLSRPVLVIAVEKSSFGTMVGVFDGDVRSNLGGYAGRLDVDSARATFFDFIGKRFALEGQPERLGTIEAVRPKVVTCDVRKILGGGDASTPGGGFASKIPSWLLKGKKVPSIAAAAKFLAWGVLEKPNFLAFAFVYDSFEECLLHRMQGQQSNLLGVARETCMKSNPQEVKIDRVLWDLDWLGDKVRLTKVPTNMTVSRIEASLWEKECETADTVNTLPDGFATARNPFFGGDFEMDVPVGKNKCAQFAVFGTARN